MEANNRKSYVCIFVYMVTKVVHLEIVSNLSTKAFLSRSTCQSLQWRQWTELCWCTEETADFDLNEAKKQIVKHTQLHLIQWNFIPVQSPHHCGLWEAGVREMKRVL